MRSSLLPIVVALVLPPATVFAEQHPRELTALSPAALDAVLTFFSIDTSVPLDAHVVDRGETLGFVREKIVFTGGRGRRVPGFLGLPRGRTPARVILLHHAGGSSKESWWQPEGYEYGGNLTQRLLEAGFAVFALDAQNHGERAHGIDYVPIPALYFGNKWWAAFRSMVVETATDYRRGLQYLEGRSELDLRRIGTVGQSMGAMTSLYLAAVDPRLDVVVAGAPALAEPWLYPLSTVNLAPAFGQKQVLLLAGTQDSLIPRRNAVLLNAAVPGDSHQLRLFDSDHRLPKEYVDLAFDWLTGRLQR